MRITKPKRYAVPVDVDSILCSAHAIIESLYIGTAACNTRSFAIYSTPANPPHAYTLVLIPNSDSDSDWMGGSRSVSIMDSDSE